MILTEKYRPTNISEIKSQEEITNILKYMTEHKEMNANFLLYGISGVGKTSCINSFANEYHGKDRSLMVLELNASANRGIETVRNIITDFISSKTFCKTTNKKIIILDEADNMTVNAQILIASLMETYKNVIFCFVCNYINKMNESISNRCLKFRFNKISLQMTKKIFKNIIAQENIDMVIDTEICKKIYNISNGDLRKGINILQLLIENNNFDYISSFMNEPSGTQINNIVEIITTENKLHIKLEEAKSYINENNLKLKNIIPYLTKYIIKNKMNRKKIIKMAEIENNLIYDFNFDIQLCSIIMLFT